MLGATLTLLHALQGETTGVPVRSIARRWVGYGALVDIAKEGLHPAVTETEVHLSQFSNGGVDSVDKIAILPGGKQFLGLQSCMAAVVLWDAFTGKEIRRFDISVI